MMSGLFNQGTKIIRALYSASCKVLAVRERERERERESLSIYILTHAHTRVGRLTCVRSDSYDIARSRYSRAFTHTI